MNILCFGDSNTWGYRPDRKGRFDENTRWTGLLQQKLGPEYHIIEEGLCGRTTIFQDELRENRRGLDMVGATVEIHNPIDLMIIMLGTNDCKNHYRASASLISKGLDQVIRKARLNASQHFDLLVISRSISDMVSANPTSIRNLTKILRLFPEILPLNTARLHSRIMLLS